MYRAEILADSISPQGVRLTTMEVEYPHAVHKDIMTHRMLSRNYRSFRASPPEVLLDELEIDPFRPDAFGKRVKGMGQRNEPLNTPDAIDQERAHGIWTHHLEHCKSVAREMVGMDIAKQQVNFVLQDICWITGIITATEWDNFFALRLDTDENGDPKARPEVYRACALMKEAMDGSKPRKLHYGQWAVPLVTHKAGVILGDSDPEWEFYKQISTGRCARVSYLTHDGIRDPKADVGLHDNLGDDGHMSPFEHQARPFTNDEWQVVRSIQRVIRDSGLPDLMKDHMIREAEFCGNLRGYVQYRKEIENEYNYGALQSRDRDSDPLSV